MISALESRSHRASLQHSALVAKQLSVADGRTVHTQANDDPERRCLGRKRLKVHVRAVLRNKSVCIRVLQRGRDCTVPWPSKRPGSRLLCVDASMRRGKPYNILRFLGRTPPIFTGVLSVILLIKPLVGCPSPVNSALKTASLP